MLASLSIELDWDDKGTWNMAGLNRCLASEDTFVVLERKAHTFIALAKGIYDIRSKHHPSPPVFYSQSFYTERHMVAGKALVVAGNKDPQWVFVEFGLNAVGKTGKVKAKIRRTYKYRVLGTALDAMTLVSGITSSNNNEN